MAIIPKDNKSGFRSLILELWPQIATRSLVLNLMESVVCGVCGVFRFDSSSPDQAVLERMLTFIEKRGPDDAGMHIKGPVALGHRRLSIIDLSNKSHQPMLDDKSGLAIVFNGSIYNYPELRSELISRGHTFFSNGDTEVILRAYKEWGEECVKRLTGMFAFVIWDPRDDSLFVARDRMGIKPLYYAKTNEGFVFGSNTQTVLASKMVAKDLDPVGLHHQLTLHAVVPAPTTIIKAVRKVRPGYHMRVRSDGTVSEKQYWQLSAKQSQEKRSDEEWVEAIHDALKLSVKRRKDIADVPVGVLLSGGLDSSLLVGLLAESGYSDVKTFTVGFDDQPEEKGSEFEFSDPVAELFGTEHHKFHVPNSELIDRLPEAIDNMAEPIVGQDAIGFYLLGEQVAKEVKVVQSGQGADEVFGGYFWYPEMADAKGEANLPRFANRYFDRDHSEWLKTINPEFHPEAGDVTGQLIERLLNQSDGHEYIDKVLQMDVSTLIVDDPVKRVDNMTMAWGLEARVPFLDHELVELAAQMPSRLKLRDGGKYALKQISRGLVPDSIIDRPKGYFPVPALKFVRGQFLDFMRDIVNSDACRQRGVFNRTMLDNLLTEPDKHFTKLQGSKLWHLALLELWMQKHLDAA